MEVFTQSDIFKKMKFFRKETIITQEEGHKGEGVPGTVMGDEYDQNRFWKYEEVMMRLNTL